MNSFIQTLNQWGGFFLSFAWPMLWQSTLLIAALFAFDFLLRRKLRASIRYALWLVVVVKLCVPPTLALPTSPAWWLQKTPPPIAARPYAMHYSVTYDNAPLPEMPQALLPAFVPPKPAMTLAVWLLMISTSISMMLLVWLLVRWWQITRQVCLAANSERLAAIADEAQKFIGMKFKVQMKLTTNSMSPAVCGLFRPAILIPQSLAENFSDEQLRAVLLHELIHLRRCDVWLNFVQALLQIFYWWHPLVWLANARIRRVREEAVDDAVMLALRDEAESYAPTLLEVAKLSLNRPLVSLGLVGIMESRNTLRQRIERLLDFRPPRHAGLTLVSLLGILAFTTVAVPMGERPSETIDLTLPDVGRNSNQVNSTVSTTNNLSADTNSFKQKMNADGLVKNGKLDYEMGKTDEAEKLFKSALALDSENATAKYSLGLVQSARQSTGIIQTGLGRKNIVEKLNRIRLPQVSFERLSLAEVVLQLNEAARQNDPEKTGVQISIATNSVSGQLADIGSVVVNLPSPLKNVRLADVLDAIIPVADQPIKYSILDDGIVFSSRSTASDAKLFMRTFSVNTLVFTGALQKQTGLQTTNVSALARSFFSKLGVDLESPKGKAVFYNDGLGRLFVRATQSDLDIVEHAIEALNSTPPQIHITARFLEVPRGIVADFGSLLNSTNSTTNQFTGILSAKNVKIILHSLESRKDVETLAEPEVVTTSGRQTQMRATQIITLVTNFALQANGTNGSDSIVPQMSTVEIGPILDIVPYVLSDGYTINLTAIPSLTEFLGYDKPPDEHFSSFDTRVRLPVVLPKFSVRQVTANLNLWDDQTVVIGGLPGKNYVGGKEVAEKSKAGDKELLVFITATIVDPAGNRVHAEDELPFVQKGVPAQPPQTK
jgi:beta-lactamase regulating signal transducer with metallopeptidase domain/type II secretory pathway component GspD/PulD (secretin)